MPSMLTANFQREAPMPDVVIAPDLRERHERLSQQLRGSKAQQRYAQFTHELIERVSKAEQENVALRGKIERLEGPFTYSECEQSHELAKSDFEDAIDELVHCVDNANRYLARRFSIEAARGREGE